PLEIVSENLRFSSDDIERSVRAKMLSMTYSRITDEFALRATARNFVDGARGNVVEENLAFGIHGQAIKFVPVADELPIFAGNQQCFERGILRHAGFHGLRPILPEPAHCIWKYRSAMFAVVRAVAPRVFDFVTGERQRAFHH